MIDLKELWKETEDRYIGKKEYFFLSPAHYSIYFNLRPILKANIKNLTLDLGAGRLGWKFLVQEYTKEYLSCDIEINSPHLNIAGDGGKLPFKDNSFKTVVCLQVLEHTKDPKKILSEIKRVLSFEGKAIISFPHLSYLHGEPQDYFRYTIHGFKELSSDLLKLVSFKESGGLLSFSLTPGFILLNSLFNRIPLVGKIVYYLLSILSLAVFYLDLLFGMKRIYPLNYITVLEKEKA